MPTVTARYLGELRVECTHVNSGAQIVTDAPLDNQGKGEAFSPTDLCATALGACALTIMGTYAQNHGVDISGTTFEVTKKMGSGPRRIVEIDVVYTMPDREYSAKEKQALENAAKACPVHYSLHPDIVQNFVFNWPM